MEIYPTRIDMIETLANMGYKVTKRNSTKQLQAKWDKYQASLESVRSRERQKAALKEKRRRIQKRRKRRGW